MRKITCVQTPLSRSIQKQTFQNNEEIYYTRKIAIQEVQLASLQS
jgi:hypothetical protein